jgi:hypothetical protein
LRTRGTSISISVFAAMLSFRALALSLSLLSSALSAFITSCKYQDPVVPTSVQGYGYIYSSPSDPTVPKEIIGNFSIEANGLEHYGARLFTLGNDQSNLVDRGVISTV